MSAHNGAQILLAFFIGTFPSVHLQTLGSHTSHVIEAARSELFVPQGCLVESINGMYCLMIGVHLGVSDSSVA